ncbi:flagellar basal-body rod protein FlgG [Achromobacter ruhlandii]|uniref:flagellar basal-body rod protein FlgG n=1 Tax=Achromobacter ruhlandii TaxID=72557 RepID=UPI003B9FFFC0
MIDSLYIGATGMHAQQTGVDVVAQNLANMNTTGYKKSYVVFEDLMTRAAAGGQPAGVLGADPASNMGLGVAIARNAKSFTTGEIKQTGKPLDLAIRGEGLLEVSMPDGSVAYTRGGTLKIDQDGMLSTLAGLPLKASISVPADTEKLTIAPDGRVTAWRNGGRDADELGKLELARFNAPEDLNSLGDGLYQATERSGEPVQGRPGEDGLGLYAQGFLESSNVQLNEEIVNLMVAQRAYEANAKVVQASDDMLGLVNNLRR